MIYNGVYGGPYEKVNRLSSRSTNKQIPSAKCVYEALIDISLNTRPKYGVSGVGGSANALTRLWDAAGKVVTMWDPVGENVTPNANLRQFQSDFDTCAPFNRRKCVGTWVTEDNKAVFLPQAYEGDADYTEDGTKGDYVAVDVTPLWWYESEDGSVLGVSAGPQSGWDIHPVCVDAEGNIRAHTYLPCYALARNASNHAVSLPGFHNETGYYKLLWDKAQTYGDGTLSEYTILEPSAVDHYEYLLQTIECATQNMQTIAAGATQMRYSNDYVSATANSTNSIVVTATIGSYFVVGQSIYVGSDRGYNPSDPNVSYNRITSIQKCNEDGTLSESGTYRLISFDGNSRDVTAGTTTVSSRPWITGACVGAIDEIAPVLGHTGSPVSNSNGMYPFMYRWRENPYGNQNMTGGDIANVRVDEGGGVYHLDWYYLENPGKYRPSTSSKPDLSDLTDPSKGWVKLGITTPSESYADGYIRTRGNDEHYPHVKVPTNTIGASSTTFFCDYATLVSSPVVRCVRRRGAVTTGAYAGPCYVYAVTAPAYGFWYFGGELFFIQ